MSNQKIKAIDAIQEAQKIAFAPFLFQAVVSLRKQGVLELIFERRTNGGITLEDISDELSISLYGVSVLLEIAESSNVVSKNDEGKYELTTIGYFLNYHETTSVNINFTNDVCYKGLFHLNDSIKSGKPEGLREFGNWNTIYEGLSQLSPEVQRSWFDFDHHYSDQAFSEALDIVFRKNLKKLYDIGGNSGKFAISCCNFNEDVSVYIVDLPGQIKRALQNVKNSGFEKRIFGIESNLLLEDQQIPKGADAIWMSQFLDCFSKEDILKILSSCVKAMECETELFIMETFTDRQRFGNAKFSLTATSLYFTSLANGNSKMYVAQELINLIEEVGLAIHEDLKVGEFHTILVCKKK